MIKSKHTQVYSKAPVDEHIVRRTLKRVQDIAYGKRNKDKNTLEIRVNE